MWTRYCGFLLAVAHQRRVLRSSLFSNTCTNIRKTVAGPCRSRRLRRRVARAGRTVVTPPATGADHGRPGRRPRRRQARWCWSRAGRRRREGERRRPPLRGLVVAAWGAPAPTRCKAGQGRWRRAGGLAPDGVPPPRTPCGRVGLRRDKDEDDKRSGTGVLTERARPGLAEAAALTRGSGLLGLVDPEPEHVATPSRVCWTVPPEIDARLRDARASAAKASRLHARARGRPASSRATSPRFSVAPSTASPTSRAPKTQVTIQAS